MTEEDFKISINDHFEKMESHNRCPGLMLTTEKLARTLWYSRITNITYSAEFNAITFCYINNKVVITGENLKSLFLNMATRTISEIKVNTWIGDSFVSTIITENIAIPHIVSERALYEEYYGTARQEYPCFIIELSDGTMMAFENLNIGLLMCTSPDQLQFFYLELYNITLNGINMDFLLEQISDGLFRHVKVEESGVNSNVSYCVNKFTLDSINDFDAELKERLNVN